MHGDRKHAEEAAILACPLACPPQIGPIVDSDLFEDRLDSANRPEWGPILSTSVHQFAIENGE
jgi:hypothetical protein